MSQEKYIGMDVHQATISVAVLDSAGKVIMECILETKGATILEFVQGLRGSLSVTFEEGTSAAWLHDLLKPHFSHLVVCDPRKNALLKGGSIVIGSTRASWQSYSAVNLLRQIPAIGPIRAALLVALLRAPDRFRTKRQLWTYSGFGLETRDSGEYRWVRCKLQRNRERITVSRNIRDPGCVGRAPETKIPRSRHKQRQTRSHGKNSQL
jgi:hypothetical protein